MLKKSVIFGKYINYNNYDIIAYNYDDKYLFCILEDNYTKYILIDDNNNWLDARYINGYVNLENKNEVIKGFENSKNKVNKICYNIKNIIDYNPIKNGLKEYILFTIWYGDNFNENRLNGYNNLLEKTGCNVINVNKNNLHHFIKKDYPIHKSFQYLSDIHKSDYLRCYIMHHYGGGYTDIKQTSDSWKNLYDELLNSNLLGYGYNCDGIAIPEEADVKLIKKLRKNFRKLIGVGFFILKPNTEFTKKWYNLLHERLDYYYEELKENPAKYSRESKSGTPKPKWEGGSLDTKYPISWNRILGQIVYPLQLQYLNKFQIKIPDWIKVNYK